jgi:nitrile hydratase beta subunit
MNGVHDMGGMMGFGPVLPEADEPVFHHHWEARAFALIRAASVHSDWSWDRDRSACENRSASEYLKMSYYEIWLASFERMLAETALLDRKPDADRVLRAKDVAAALKIPINYERKPQSSAKFGVGDPVRTLNMNPEGHTRLPRYLRKAKGEIAAVHGAHVFPDTNAHGQGEDPQWLYTVRFSGEEIWGNGAKHTLHATLWEPYLQAG